MIAFYLQDMQCCGQQAGLRGRVRQIVGSSCLGIYAAPQQSH